MCASKAAEDSVIQMRKQYAQDKCNNLLELAYQKEKVKSFCRTYCLLPP